MATDCATGVPLFFYLLFFFLFLFIFLVVPRVTAELMGFFFSSFLSSFSLFLLRLFSHLAGLTTAGNRLAFTVDSPKVCYSTIQSNPAPPSPSHPKKTPFQNYRLRPPGVTQPVCVCVYWQKRTHRSIANFFGGGGWLKKTPFSSLPVTQTICLYTRF